MRTWETLVLASGKGNAVELSVALVARMGLALAVDWSLDGELRAAQRESDGGPVMGIVRHADLVFPARDELTGLEGTTRAVALERLSDGWSEVRIVFAVSTDRLEAVRRVGQRQLGSVRSASGVGLARLATDTWADVVLDGVPMGWLTFTPNIEQIAWDPERWRLHDGVVEYLGAWSVDNARSVADLRHAAKRLEAHDDQRDSQPDRGGD